MLIGLPGKRCVDVELHGTLFWSKTILRSEGATIAIFSLLGCPAFRLCLISIHCSTERFTWRVHLLRASVEMAATFTVGEQIGRGQYGQVYRATYEGSQVAIKRILIDGGGHEYEGMKKLDHPNVLKLLHLEDKDPFRLRLFSRISFRISVHFFKLKFENAGT